MGRKKKDEEYIPSDRMCLYTPVPILEKLEKLGKKNGGISKQQMALLIINEHLKEGV